MLLLLAELKLTVKCCLNLVLQKLAKQFTNKANVA